MALARTWSMALSGIRGRLVEIEADIGAGLPGTKLVGLPDAGLREAKDRCRSAVRNTGFSWPATQVTLGLSPADLPKLGSGYDLGIAVSVLVAAGVVPPEKTVRTVWLGELALDGRVRAVRGVLPCLLAARASGVKVAVVPVDCLHEAALVEGIDVFGAARLGEVLDWMRDEGTLSSPAASPVVDAAPVPDLADVVGQADARWALEVAAAGGHHLMMVGPPGVGKTMLARRLAGLLPELTDDEALEVMAVQSVDGSLPAAASLMRVPPVVAPHHSISLAALIGGGSGVARPGAVSKAHRGVLILDEACEFNAHHLDALRTALEDGEVRLARARGIVRYPARFQLVLATNPCACAPPRETDCSCAPFARRRYLGRLSGPLLDRVDIRVHMHPVRVMDAGAYGAAESTAVVRERVLAARERAAWRWSGRGWRTNAEVPAKVLRGELALEPAASGVLDRALERGVITARGADRCLRLAWTLADVAGVDRPGVQQVGQALDFREQRAA